MYMYEKAIELVRALTARKKDARTKSPRWPVILLAASIAVALSVSIYLYTDYMPLWVGPQLLYGVEGSDPSILVIQKGNRYGYGDAEGNVLIPPVYEDARPFFEGLAAVKKNGRYGYIDTEGNTVILFRFVDALNFHDGHAIVGTKWIAFAFLKYHPNCLVIDRQGNTVREVSVSENNWHWLRDFSEGYYTINDYYLMDSSGYPFHMGRGMAAGFHEGLARRYVQDGQCFVDASGNVILEGFERAGDFCGGLASAKKGDLWGYIDRTGTYVIEPAFAYASNFGEGLALVTDVTMREWTIINESGDTVCGVKGYYKSAGSFSEGLCAVMGNIRAGKTMCLWGFIDSTGKLVVDCKYKEVTPFMNGIAQVMLPDGKIGYIDKAGNYIWEPK